MAIYDLDITGELAANRITNEQSVISPGSPDLHGQLPYVIPQFAPFFDNAGFELRRNGVPLTKDVDYQFAAQLYAARDMLGKNVYGAIVFLDRNAVGSVAYDYNTIGSDFITNDPQLLAEYFKTLLQQRTVNWDKVYGVPFQLPPIQDQENLADLKGTDDIVDALADIAAAIADADSGPLVAAINALGDALLNHTSQSNPHGIDKSTIGLDQINDWGRLSDLAQLYYTAVSGAQSRRYLATGNDADWDLVRNAVLQITASATVNPNTTNNMIFRSSSLANIDLNGLAPSGDLYVMQIRTDASPTAKAAVLSQAPRLQIGLLVNTGNVNMPHIMFRYIDPNESMPVWTVAPNWSRLKTMLDNITSGLQQQVDTAVANRIRYGSHAPTNADFQKVGDIYYRHEA